MSERYNEADCRMVGEWLIDSLQNNTQYYTLQTIPNKGRRMIAWLEDSKESPPSTHMMRVVNMKR